MSRNDISPYEPVDFGVGRIVREYKEGKLAYADAIENLLTVLMRDGWVLDKSNKSRDYVASFLKDGAMGGLI